MGSCLLSQSRERTTRTTTRRQVEGFFAIVAKSNLKLDNSAPHLCHVAEDSTTEGRSAALAQRVRLVRHRWRIAQESGRVSVLGDELLGLVRLGY